MSETPRLPFSDPHTSLEAARQHADASVSQEQRVLIFIQGRTPPGAADFEGKAALDMSNESYTARRVGLVRKGLVRHTGADDKIVDPKTGKRVYRWIYQPGAAQPKTRGEGKPKTLSDVPDPQQLRVLRTLLDGNRTRDEVGLRLGVDRKSTNGVSARLNEITRMGLAEKTSGRRQLQSGQSGALWRITEKGRLAVEMAG